MSTPLIQDLRHSNGSVATGSEASMDAFSPRSSGDEDTIETLLAAARADSPDVVWAAYRAGEQMHLLGQGGPGGQWPTLICRDHFDAFCDARQLQRLATGRGEGVLGWLLVPAAHSRDRFLTDLAGRLGSRMQADALARAQITQRVLYEISYLASSTRDRHAFLQGVHRQLATLIDAENFYLAFYDDHTRKISYPYYIDITDVDALEAEAHEHLDRTRLTLTGHVLITEQPLFVDAAAILQAEAHQRFYCAGHRPEFWMGAPLKNASDEVFGMLAMQVYDVARIYSAEDRALFLVVARHVAMALDRILHRADLEETVMRRTLELSALNDALRQEVLDRERAEHLQSALFQIAELSSQPGDMAELFQTLHGIVGELLFAQNFYIALFDDAISEVTFPYYVDERLTTHPAARRGRRGLTEYVIRQRRPCLIDAGESERLSASGETERAHESVRAYSWLGIPLFDGEVVRGVLAVQSYTSQVCYTLRDQELLTFVSRHIDTALSRRTAAEAIHAANLKLEARVQNRTRELDHANAKLQHENSHDALTGLANRTYLQQRLNQAWSQFDSEGGHLAVMFIDLDRFKK